MQELVPYSWHYFSRINSLYVEHSVSGVLEQSSTFFKICKQSWVVCWVAYMVLERSRIAYKRF